MDKQAFDALQAQWAAEAEARKVERDNKQARIQEMHRLRDAGTLKDRPIPSLNEVYQAQRQTEIQTEQQAERDRVAAIPARDLWFSTLPWAEQQRVQRWEQINHMAWPVPGSVLKDFEAAKKTPA